MDGIREGLVSSAMEVLMQEKRMGNRNKPTRYVVERVYSGKESMERLLTSVTEEAARQNVEDKLKKTEK